MSIIISSPNSVSIEYNNRLHIKIFTIITTILFILLWLTSTPLFLYIITNFGLKGNITPDYQFGKFLNEFIQVSIIFILLGLFFTAFLNKTITFNFSTNELELRYNFSNLSYAKQFLPFSDLQNMELLDNPNKNEKDLSVISDKTFRKKLHLKSFFEPLKSDSEKMAIIQNGIDRYRTIILQYHRESEDDSKSNTAQTIQNWHSDKRILMKVGILLTIVSLMILLITFSMFVFIEGNAITNNSDALIFISIYLMIIVFSLFLLIYILTVYVRYFDTESINFYTRKEFLKDMFLNTGDLNSVAKAIIALPLIIIAMMILLVLILS